MEKIDLKSVKISLKKDEMLEISGGSCTGSHIMGCVSDVYTNHGWASVAAFLVTGYCPQLGVAYTIACAAKNGC